ncbi:MAG: hybrid sensor histidine kinase/response regulator [Gemmatimonadetes bacterium]|nr:MAG: hybrid sensor histidine kinase/response regulator [Gemmatimonadota bacterium]
MPTLARILIVEDVATDAELIEREIRRAGIGCATRRVDTETALREALRSFAPDLVLTDHSMPRLTARDTLRLVHQETPDAPVIIVTGSLDEEIAAEYMKAGATDYVVKHHLERLGPAAQRALDLKQAREEQAQAEEARRQGEERFRALIEHGADAIALLSADGTVLFLSHSAEKLFGFAPSELAGRSALELLHPDDAPRLLGLLADLAARPGTPLTIELRLLHRDASWRAVEAVVVNRLGEPAVGAIVVNFRDISERKEAELALRDSEEQYRSLVEGVRDVIFALSPDGIIASLNPAFETITGSPRGEWLGKPFDQLVHPEDLPLALELFGRVVRGEERPTAQFRIHTSKGDYRLAEFSATAQLRDDRLIGILGIGRDVTERVQLEQQLRQAQKMEAVGRLAGGIAHDFNNILTAITGYADLLLEDLAPKDPRRQDAEEIHKAADRAAGLTRQLLAFSRQQVLQPRVVDLNALVSELEKMLRRLLGEDVKLATVLAPTLGRVRADAGQLEQVIMNLAVNARDAMPTGGQLTIETADVEFDGGYAAEHYPAPPGKYAMLAVSDTGTGMDPETQAHLFEPFFTTKEKGKGTGLGLATVYGIVKQSGGFIWVYSELGAGTTFKIYLPRVEGAVEPASGRAAPVPVARGSETVLVAEDEAPVRAVARHALERYGYRVLEAASAEAALDVAQRYSGPIHVLLTDVIMPGLSGRDLATRLAALRPETRVIYMSGYTDDAITRHGVLEPGFVFVQKPFTPDTLARTVRDVLDGTIERRKRA